MTSLTTQRPAISIPESQWITPQEQLERIYSRERFVPERRFIRDLAGVVDRLDPELTNWYTALERLKALPEKIPPLPWHIGQILASKSPIHNNNRIRNTHFLTLIPEGLKTLNELAELVGSYGESQYCPKDRYGNPLRFKFFLGKARQEHGDVPFEPTHWELMTTDVLPGSRNKSYKQQVAMIERLSQKSFVHYEVPSLKSTAAALFLYKVATGETLCPEADEDYGVNIGYATYTRVQEATQDGHWILGSSVFNEGFRISNDGNDDHESRGMMTLRRWGGVEDRSAMDQISSKIGHDFGELGEEIKD